MANSVPSLSDVFPEYDPRSQLLEIGLLLDHLLTWRNDLRGQLSEATFDFQNSEEGSIERAIAHDTGGTLAYHSCFRDAACSQAGVGVLAPFVEGLLVHLFRYLCTLPESRAGRKEHHRWKLEEKEFWDPHLVSDAGILANNRDVFRGTKQMLESLNIRADFPESIDKVLEALFCYRNKVMHFGNEWPPVEREKFRKLVEEKDWGSWFSWSMSGQNYWIAYAQDEFLQTCLATSKELLSSFWKVADRWGGRIN